MRFSPFFQTFRRPVTRRRSWHGSNPKSPFRACVQRLEARCLLAASGTQQLLPSYGRLPLAFEANQGQADAQVNFLSHGSGYGLFLAPGGAVLSLQKPASPPAAPGSPPVAHAPGSPDTLRVR